MDADQYATHTGIDLLLGTYVRGNRKHGDPRYERTVVVTAETQPNFDSGSAAWTPDERQTWFALPDVTGYWAVGFADPKHGWFVGNMGKS